MLAGLSEGTHCRAASAMATLSVRGRHAAAPAVLCRAPISRENYSHSANTTQAIMRTGLLLATLVAAVRKASGPAMPSNKRGACNARDEAHATSSLPVIGRRSPPVEISLPGAPG